MKMCSISFDAVGKSLNLILNYLIYWPFFDWQVILEITNTATVFSAAKTYFHSNVGLYEGIDN